MIELVWVSYVTCQVLGKKCCSTESRRAAFFRSPQRKNIESPEQSSAALLDFWLNYD